MKGSIRYKLLFYMLVSVALFAALLILCNSFLVEKIYLNQNKKDLLNSASEVQNLIESAEYDEEKNAYYFGDTELDTLAILERFNGHTIYISNVEGKLFYPYYMHVDAAKLQPKDSLWRSIYIDSNLIRAIPGQFFVKIEDAQDAQEYDQLDPLEEMEIGYDLTAPSSIQSVITVETETFEIIKQIDDNSFFALVDDGNLNTKILRYDNILDSGLRISIEKPMNIISDAVTISNQISTAIGLVVIAFIILWSWFISKRFTRPIEEINRVTNQMCALDFSASLKAEGSDEIAQLSENVNHLSNILGETIGELNQKNKKLAEDIDKERKIDKMRREFISNVSHELKTPIFLIQGYADGLRSNVINDAEKKDFYCDVIAEETEKMDTLVKDLLELARLESGADELSQSEFEITTYLEAIIEKYQIPCKEKKIELNFIPMEKTTVKADLFKIEQVITNLINNAIDHIDGARQIQIVAEKTAAEQVRVSVYNTGKAISEESMEKIWGSFYKADSARNRDFGGAGLGLSIVKVILDAHESPYGVYNTEEGVVFWFELRSSLPEPKAEEKS